MNVTTIQMEPAEAEAKLEHYREVLSKRHGAAIEEEFNAAVTAYSQLAKGTPLINPISAIRECGWRDDGRPVLAIARADQKQVLWRTHRTSRTWNPETHSFTGNWSPMEWEFTAQKKRWDQQRARNLVFEVSGIIEEPPQQPKDGVAMVPMVPADVYPSRGLDLSKHFILWEVENWNYAPPVDPILLKPIGGDLYAVIAQWDLTEIERTIIAGTRRQS